jgi:two-component system sensor histidine kinase RpfC
VTSVSGARAALETLDEATAPPIMIFDRETMSEAAFGNLAAILVETGRHIVVGVLSETPDDSTRTAGFPLSLSIGPRVGPDDWTRLMAASRHAMPDRSVADPVAPSAPLRILVAEDNITNQQVIRRLLERDGHEIVIAVNGEDAVEALEKDSFDLVLMDINMPVMNGYEATKLHRFASLGRRRVPIHALTADVTPETREKAEQAGMDGCLHKPIDRDELNAVIGAISRAKANLVTPVETPPTAENRLALQQEFSGADAAAEVVTLDFNTIPAVDAAVLAGLADLGGPQFMKELSQQFVADAWRKLDEIGSAIADVDAQAFVEITHSLRSSSANLGARRLFAMCLEWRGLGPEQLAREGDEKLALLRATLMETEADLSAISARIQFDNERKLA